jgi:hypothetical protein
VNIYAGAERRPYHSEPALDYGSDNFSLTSGSHWPKNSEARYWLATPSLRKQRPPGPPGWNLALVSSGIHEHSVPLKCFL